MVEKIEVFVHFSCRNQATECVIRHIKWTYFRYENLSAAFFHKIWNFLCFKYGNLTLYIPVWNRESIYSMEKIWTLIFLCMTGQMLCVPYEHLGVYFLTWNVEFSTFALLKYKPSFDFWNRECFIFYIWNMGAVISTLNM